MPHDLALSGKPWIPFGVGRIAVKHNKNNGDASGRGETHEPGKNAQKPGKYVKDDAIDQPTITIIDAGKLNGFDPYNSGSFDKSKSWEAHSRYKRTF